MRILSVLLLASLFCITGCDSKPEERTELSDYKKRHLDKAKEVEAEVNKRVENINKQLQQNTNSKDEDN